MTKPYYVIDFSAVNCMIDLRINDVSVLCMNIEGQLSTIIPINNAILGSGKQQVSYNILPMIGKTSLQDSTSFFASVWLYDAGGELIEPQEEINNFKLPDMSTPLPAYKYENFFFADVPYQLEAWQNSQDLGDIRNLREVVDYAYRKIERLINSSQYNEFAALIEKRENNIAKCMYLSDEEKKERINELIGIISAGFKIVPTSEKDIMVMYAYDKLVTLKKDDGNSALLLKNDRTGEMLNLELQFHLEKDKNGLSII